MKKNRIAAATLLGALSLGIGAPAFAQTATTIAPVAASSTAPTREARQAEHNARHDAQASDLANRLGITKEKVLAAMEAQKSTPIQRPTTGVRPTAAERKSSSTARVASFASALGVSVDALTKSLADQQKAQIDTQAADGWLTADQATARKAVVDADAAAGDLHGLGGRGGHGGRGRR
jgi:predicted ArsR family transcriptional regulator